MTMKFITLSEGAVENMLMSAWVDGWYQKDNKTDDGKRTYSETIIKRLPFKEMECGKQ